MSIVLTELTKRFDDVPVVNHISLEIQDGELFVLLGGSGSGKSTILRLIAGLLEPDEGRIELDGKDVTWLPPQARGVGFVFQNYSIFRHMTAAQNIEFGLRIRGVTKRERSQRVEELLELVGLSGLGARYPDQLSGGQQQRVALARALAYRPAVLLLDEPFGALDVKIRVQMRQSLKEIQRRLQVTTILVTHDQEEAFELGDRVGVIERGHLIEVGNPEALYHHPRMEFVATFIGGGNVLVGRAVAGRIQLGSVTLPLPAHAPRHDEGAPVRILFRPESVVLRAEPFDAQGGVHVLGQGRIVERIFAGSLQRLRVEVEGLRGVRPLAPRPVYGQHTTLIEAIPPSGEGHLNYYVPGQRLWLGIQTYHVLEPTGLNILICPGEEPATHAAAEFGCRLAQAAQGPATLLAVVESDSAIALVRDRLEELRQCWMAHLPRLETRVRQGNRAEQILLEAQEGHYELVVLGRTPTPQQMDLEPVARQLLEWIELPVLLVQQPRSPIERMLICTAAGEPGKVDVLFGGRLARRVGAWVTVLHIPRSQAPQAERARAERHLRRAQASLEALGVRCRIKIEEEPALKHILSEAESGDYDLIVIGAPGPRTPYHFRQPDMATQIITGTTRPVLVVPLAE
jgi:sulfate transport system ATP-binding protein